MAPAVKPGGGVGGLGALGGMRSGHRYQCTMPPVWNAGFIRQVYNRRVLLPDKSGVPVVVSRCVRVSVRSDAYRTLQIENTKPPYVLVITHIFFILVSVSLLCAQKPL